VDVVGSTGIELAVDSGPTGTLVDVVGSNGAVVEGVIVGIVATAEATLDVALTGWGLVMESAAGVVVDDENGSSP
jgi:hypothetical protein